MNIEDFVSTSLTQIIAGVKKAQLNEANEGAQISPANLNVVGGGSLIYETESALVAQEVEFDIAVTATEDSKTGGGGEVAVLGVVNVGAKAQSGKSNESVSRLKFKVALILPQTPASGALTITHRRGTPS